MAVKFTATALSHSSNFAWLAWRSVLMPALFTTRCSLPNLLVHLVEQLLPALAIRHVVLDRRCTPALPALNSGNAAFRRSSLR